MVEKKIKYPIIYTCPVCGKEIGPWDGNKGINSGFRRHLKKHKGDPRAAYTLRGMYSRGTPPDWVEKTLADNPQPWGEPITFSIIKDGKKTKVNIQSTSASPNNVKGKAREQARVWNKPKPGSTWTPKRESKDHSKLDHRISPENADQFISFIHIYFKEIWKKIIEGFPNKELSIEELYIQSGRKDIHENIIVDPLAYYVPYHVNPEKYGIYYRINNIETDLKEYLRNCCNINTPSYELMQNAFKVYWATLYTHELCHHVIEDDASIREKFDNKTYSMLKRKHEEGFCEYIAFTTVEKIGSKLVGNDEPSLILGNKGDLFPELNFETQDNIFFFLQNKLYYHWIKNKNSIYEPQVYPEVPETLTPSWKALWNHHLDRKILTKNPEEIYNRIYITKSNIPNRHPL